MCNCNSPWVQKAKDVFNKLEQEINQLTNDNSSKELTLARYYSIGYLLDNNYCGIKNRAKIGNILAFLETKGISISRENFQNNVLIFLKRNGSVASLIYPSKGGGVFIPCRVSDVEKVVSQVLNRIESKLNNILGIVEDNNQEISNINNSINSILEHINQERKNNNIR